MRISVLLLFVGGAALRLAFMNSFWLKGISSRVEVSTPLNSWSRVKEGLYLLEEGVSPYSGGVVHESPVYLYLFGFILRYWKSWIPFIFVACDLSTAFLLGLVASDYSKKLLLQQAKDKEKYASDASHLLVKTADVSGNQIFVIAVYLFCPYTVASCLGKTTTVFNNLLLAASIAAMMKDKPALFGSIVAVASYQALYPVCLLVPGVLTYCNEKSIDWGKITKIVLSFTVTLTITLMISVEIAGNWQFMEATYGFMMSAPDLTPNIGLFWYFFTEMFEHFRVFFLFTFQINCFIYVLPLAIRLRRDPLLLAVAVMAFLVAFRSYPCVGDLGIHFALLPLWRHLYSFMRQTLVVACMFVATSVLGPIMYNLWIFNGCANANFYFAITLAFTTAQIFLVTDLLFAYVKWKYHLINGFNTQVDGKPGKLTLI